MRKNFFDEHESTCGHTEADLNFDMLDNPRTEAAAGVLQIDAPARRKAA